jgi:hypothetical protein
MASAMTTNADIMELDNIQDGFEELLIALNPYVEEVLHQPTFHLFMDLPAVRITPPVRCPHVDLYDFRRSVA